MKLFFGYSFVLSNAIVLKGILSANWFFIFFKIPGLRKVFGAEIVTWREPQNHREVYQTFPDLGKNWNTFLGKDDLDSILELLMLMHGWREVSVLILSGS